jgi:MFS family permease
MKYIHGSVFLNTTISSITEAISYVISGILYEKLKPKVALIISFMIASFSVLGIIILESIHNENDNCYECTFLVFGTRFGISSAFNIVYLLTFQIFPTEFLSTAFGICNVLARLATIFAPMVAEISGFTPLIIFFMTSSLSAVCTLFLRLN